MRADAAELVGGGAGFGLEQFDAVHDGTGGAATFLCDLGHGQSLDVVKPEHRGQARVFSAAATVDFVQDKADAAGEVLVGLLGDLRDERSEKVRGGSEGT